MWYLQTDTLLILAVFSSALAVFRIVGKNKSEIWLLRLLPVVELAILCYISQRLAVFYIAYIAMGLIFAELLFRFRKAVLFALFSALALVPFFLSRSETFGLTLPFVFVSIGIAYQMLKLIDVYYYVYFAEERIDSFVFINYMLFLPVFTSGPIFRYREFVATCKNPILLNSAELTTDFKRIVRGLFKKLVLTSLGLWMLSALLNLGMHWYVSLLAPVLSYVILYCDLSGYSDIAVAFGRIAGFQVPENFKTPWKAPSFTQFWRCWHASLSNWIRDHLFVLFSKKRLNSAASAILCLITMVVMSLWHGFNLMYLAAGIYNGLLLAAENLLRLTTVNKRKIKRPIYVTRCVAVNFLFALNTMVFLLTPEQVLSVLHGFVLR